MTQEKIRVGFVGLSANSGWAASTLGPALVHPSVRDKYDLVAVSTTSEASAKASAEKQSQAVGHPVKAYFGDASAIASDPDVDLVAVAVKAPYHKQIVLKAIEAKKDFFVEWPAGTSTKETEEIAAAAQKQGVKSLVGLQGRNALVTQKVKELLASGVIGKVRSTNVIAHHPREINYHVPYNFEENAYLLERKNGVTMFSIAVGHQLDILTHVLGDFASVSATSAQFYPVVTILGKDLKPTGKTFDAQNEDHFAITGILKSGVMANIFWRSGYSSTEGRRQYIWEIEGEEGTIRLESNHILGAFPAMIESELYLNGKKVEGHGNGVVTVSEAWKEFATGKGSYATIDDAVKHHRLLDAIESDICRLYRKYLLNASSFFFIFDGV